MPNIKPTIDLKDPMSAARAILTELSDLGSRLDAIGRVVHDQGLAIERHRLELVRVRRELNASREPRTQPSAHRRSATS